MHRDRPKLWLSILCLLPIPLILLCSCGGGSGDSSAAKEPEKPAHPWEWEPTEPELVTGKAIYTKACASCHNEGESGAPRLGSSKKWGERSAKGLPVLIKNAIEGVSGEDGEMPPKGDSPELTDGEVAAAVKFMVAAPK